MTKQVLIIKEKIWYDNLISDLKKINFKTLILGRWLIGKRILKEQEERKYGEQTIEKIAKDLQIKSRELWRYIQFAKKCHDVTEFENKSWRFIVNQYLPVHLKERKSFLINLKNIQNYDSNIFYFLKEQEDSFLNKNILCIDITHTKRIFKKYFPTITTKSILLYPNGIEFSLRDYARVQDFPDDFKFTGSPQEIKRQIGNAVSPKMSKHIIKKYIKGKTFIDLFCGCGGFSLGAINIGKQCLWGCDFDKFASYSFKLNFPKTQVCNNDITKIDEKEIHKKIGDIDFIIAGCPCQGFSQAGKCLGFEDDERNLLYQELIKFLKYFKPKQFIMENVPSILKYKNKIISDFERVGYSMQIEKVRGLDIGMKQHRTRVFFIGELKKGAKN